MNALSETSCSNRFRRLPSLADRAEHIAQIPFAGIVPPDRYWEFESGLMNEAIASVAEGPSCVGIGYDIVFRIDLLSSRQLVIARKISWRILAGSAILGSGKVVRLPLISDRVPTRCEPRLSP